MRGPKLWNKVPVAIKAEKTFDGFKVSLSKFLALIPDNPPGFRLHLQLVQFSRGLHINTVVRYLMTLPT